MSFTIRRVSPEPKKSAVRTWLKTGIALLPAVLQFQKHFSHANEENLAEKKREKKLKRTVTILLSILLVLVLLIGTLKVLLRIKALGFGMVGIVGADLPVDKNGFTNVLLIGTGDKDHSGVDLTDTIIIASIDATRTKSVVLLSIPRDMYFLKTEQMGVGRVNSLYRDYKGYLLKTTEKGEASDLALQELGTEISKILDLPIHGIVKVNFSGFEETIDLIGGIDIVVPEDIVDVQYPGPNYSYQTFRIGAGPQHIDGATALKYARTRHTTSDFSRSARQQQIIAAAAKKIKEEGMLRNAGRMTEILSIVSKNVESTLSIRELLGLAELGKAVDMSRIVSIQLNDQNGILGGGVEAGGLLYAPPREEFEGASVLLPVSIPASPITWKMVQTFSKLLFGKREAFIRPVKIGVLNAGSKVGSARKLGSELLRQGFDVVHIGSLPRTSPKVAVSVIAVNPLLIQGGDQTMNSLKRAQWNQALLTGLLRMTTGESIDPEAFQNESPDIVILLGEDYLYLPFQNLLSKSIE